MLGSSTWQDLGRRHLTRSKRNHVLERISALAALVGELVSDHIGRPEIAWAPPHLHRIETLILLSIGPPALLHLARRGQSTPRWVYRPVHCDNAFVSIRIQSAMAVQQLRFLRPTADVSVG